jgi:hypothetical protein
MPLPPSICPRRLLALPLCIVNAGLIGGHHVLDVDERVITPLLLKQGQGVGYELTQAVVVALPVVNPISKVPVQQERGGGGSNRGEGGDVQSTMIMVCRLMWMGSIWSPSHAWGCWLCRFHKDNEVQQPAGWYLHPLRALACDSEPDPPELPAAALAHACQAQGLAQSSCSRYTGLPAHILEHVPDSILAGWLREGYWDSCGQCDPPRNQCD